MIKLAQKNAEKAAHRDHDLHDTERQVCNLFSSNRDHLRICERYQTTITSQTEDLEKAAGIYNAKAEQARRKMWWKDMKVKVLVAVIVLVLLVGITLGVLNQIGVLSLFGGSRPTAAPSP